MIDADNIISQKSYFLIGRSMKLTAVDRAVKTAAQKKNVSPKTVNVRIVNTVKVASGAMNHFFNSNVLMMDAVTTIIGQMTSTNRNSIISPPFTL